MERLTNICAEIEFYILFLYLVFDIQNNILIILIICIQI